MTVSRPQSRGRRRSFVLAGQTWITKSAVVAQCRKLLGAYRGQAIPESETGFLRDLLELHPERDRKVGSGVAGFKVAQAPDHPTSWCFHVVRTDGTSTDFSFGDCLTSEKSGTARSLVFRACREAIKAQIFAFRDTRWPARSGSLVCPLTAGEQFTYDEAHVDHAPPNTFEVLVGCWLVNEFCRIEDVLVTHGADNTSDARLSDPGMCCRWQNYHRTYAKLRLVSKQGNLTQGRARPNREPVA